MCSFRANIAEWASSDSCGGERPEGRALLLKMKFPPLQFEVSDRLYGAPIRDVERVLGPSALAERLLQLGHAFRQLLLLMIELQEHSNLGHEDP